MTENTSNLEFNKEDIEIKNEEEEEVEYSMEILQNEMEEDIFAGVEPVSFVWTTEATTCLIDQYKRLRSHVGQTARMRSLRDMFEIISIEMKKRNFFFSAQKCENKWRVLERKYKQLVYREKLNKPGRIKDFHNWKYKKAMDEIYQNNLQQSSLSPKLLESMDNITNNANASDPKSSSKECNKMNEDLITADDGELATILKNTFNEIKKIIDISEQNKERRHREKMAMKKAKLEVQKKLLNLKAQKIEVERNKLLAAAKQLQQMSEFKF